VKASALIKRLQELVDEHGDLPVYAPDKGCGCCDMGPGPVDPPEFRSTYTDYGESLPNRFHVSQ
jgi:hypothetical protein